MSDLDLLTVCLKIANPEGAKLHYLPAAYLSAGAVMLQHFPRRGVRQSIFRRDIDGLGNLAVAVICASNLGAAR